MIVSGDDGIDDDDDKDCDDKILIVMRKKTMASAYKINIATFNCSQEQERPFDSVVHTHTCT